MGGSIHNFFPLKGWPIALFVMLTQFLASYIVNLFSYNKLSKIYKLFKPRKFEKNGALYQDVFKIKEWKDYIPSISSFDKKNMKVQLTPNYISQFLLEGIRAELCHVLAIIFSIVILIFSISSAWFFIIVYTLILNVPCILIQRYNRPRFERLLRKKDEKGNVILDKFWIKDNGKPQTAREEKHERHQSSEKEETSKEDLTDKEN